MSNATFTGGCQCGAVRYRLLDAPYDPHLCHCRMCQKQFGNYFAALATIAHDKFLVTRGALSHFQSSSEVSRGFCKDCRTPLTYEPSHRKNITFANPSLDNPNAVVPNIQYGTEAVSPSFASLHALPAYQTGFDAQGNEHVAWRESIAKSARQHPDHDTDHWTLK